jgi:multisubunit Na+/H+ antiporter MnhF subunit
LLFVLRLLRGPDLPDRVIAADGFVSTIVIGVTIAAARGDLRVVEATVLVVALAGFVGTAMLARFIERRGA